MKNLLLLSLLIFLTSNLFGQTDKGLNWMTWEEVVEAEKKEPRKVFVDVYTDWCGWCKRMDMTTFKNKDFIEYMNTNYYMVKFDAEQKEDVVIGDSTFKYDAKIGRRGCHELALTLLQGKMSYPTVVFLQSNFNIIQPLAGYRQGDEMLKVAKYLGEDIWKTQTWEEYNK